jgi:hypothetical protein
MPSGWRRYGQGTLVAVHQQEHVRGAAAGLGPGQVAALAVFHLDHVGTEIAKMLGG